MITTYTIDRLKYHHHFTDDVIKFFKDEIPKLSERFGDKFDYNNCPLYLLAETGHFYICRRNGEIRGYLLAFISKSVFDPKIKILKQQSLYVKPDSGRTAYWLFKKFIDIGKTEANHIITMLTSQTNIKSETLENMGFKELETLYRLEVK
jgi:hypothetical protein